MQGRSKKSKSCNKGIFLCLFDIRIVFRMFMVIAWTPDIYSLPVVVAIGVIIYGVIWLLVDLTSSPSDYRNRYKYLLLSIALFVQPSSDMRYDERSR